MEVDAPFGPGSAEGRLCGFQAGLLAVVQAVAQRGQAMLEQQKAADGQVRHPAPHPAGNRPEQLVFDQVSRDLAGHRHQDGQIALRVISGHGVS